MVNHVEQINTLSEFLTQSQSQYRVFDMGRKVQKISSDTFNDFENAKAPYPYPLQQHAWLAILFWNKQASNQQYIWFLKLPLDERGLLEQASRSQFLELVMTALGRSMEKQPTKEEQSALDHNPIIFKPSEQKLAAFNALVGNVMKRPASQYMTSAIDYLNTPSRYQHWQEVPYQGLADIASRCDDPMFSQMLCDALPNLPPQTFCALCGCLENFAVNSAIASILLTKLRQSIEQQDVNMTIHCARGLSHAKGKGFQEQAMTALLASNLIKSELDIVVIIAARYWQLIDSTDCAVAVLEALSVLNVAQSIFNQVFSDLVAIPSVRIHMHSALRYPQRSEALAKHIAKLIAGE